MTDVVKIWLTLFAASGLAIISAILTILGYSSMFVSSYTLAVWLFIALEIAKVVIAYRAKVDYLLIFEAVLMVFAAIGHFGFLSDAYWRDRLSAEQSILSIEQTKDLSQKIIESKQRELDNLNVELEHLQTSVQGFKGSYSKLTEARANQQRLDELRREIRQVNEDIEKLIQRNKDSSQEQKKTLQETHNTIKYSADTLGVQEETFASWVILIASLTIDPLALALIFTFSREFKAYKEFCKGDVNHNIITLQNAKEYTVDGMSVDDMVAFSDTLLLDSLKIFNSPQQMNWLYAVLCYRDSVKTGKAIENYTLETGKHLLNELKKGADGQADDKNRSENGKDSSNDEPKRSSKTVSNSSKKSGGHDRS